MFKSSKASENKLKEKHFLEGDTLSSPNLLSPPKKKDQRAIKKKEKKKESCDTAPPHLIFEQGEILKCFPQLDIK